MTRAMSSTGMPSVMATMTRDAGVGRFHDGVGGGRRRHEDHAWRWPRSSRTASATVLNSGKPSLRGAALAGRDAADDLRAVLAALLGVEGAGLAEALDRGRGCSCRRGCSWRCVFLTEGRGPVVTSIDNDRPGGRPAARPEVTSCACRPGRTSGPCRRRSTSTSRSCPCRRTSSPSGTSPPCRRAPARRRPWRASSSPCRRCPP